MICRTPGPHNVPTFERCLAGIWTGLAAMRQHDQQSRCDAASLRPRGASLRAWRLVELAAVKTRRVPREDQRRSGPEDRQRLVCEESSPILVWEIRAAFAVMGITLVCDRFLHHRDTEKTFRKANRPSSVDVPTQAKTGLERATKHEHSKECSINKGNCRSLAWLGMTTS